MESAPVYLVEGVRCEYLLRIVEDAHVVLRRQVGRTQLLPVRCGDFQSEGAYGWGGAGEGVKALASALLADAASAQGANVDLDQRAHHLLHNLLSGLDSNQPYTFTDLQILRAAAGH